jgi:hypothetical protein
MRQKKLKSLGQMSWIFTLNPHETPGASYKANITLSIPFSNELHVACLDRQRVFFFFCNIFLSLNIVLMTRK